MNNPNTIFIVCLSLALSNLVLECRRFYFTERDVGLKIILIFFLNVSNSLSSLYCKIITHTSEENILFCYISISMGFIELVLFFTFQLLPSLFN